MKTVLVTGSDGFVGRLLVARLRKKFKVVCFDVSHGKDVTRFKDFTSVGKVDVVVHLAGLTFVPDARDRPLDFFNVNVMGTYNVAEFCRLRKAKLIFASSYLYGHPTYLPIDEEHPLDLYNPYAMSKYLAEEGIAYYEEEYGLQAICLRFFNIYGSGQNDNFLIPKIVSQLKKGKITLHDAKPKRDFVHVEDVVSAYVKALSFTGSGVFNIGSGKSYSVQEIVDRLVELSGKKVKVSYSGKRRKNEVMDCVANISKAKRLLKWKPSIDIDTGLRMMLG